MRSEGIVGDYVTMLPLPVHRPAAIVHYLKPCIAFCSMMANAERLAAQVPLAFMLDADLHSLGLSFREGERIRVHEYLRGSPKQAPPKHESKHHRQEPRVESKCVVKRRVQLRLIDDDRSEVPCAMREHCGDHLISAWTRIVRSMKASELLRFLEMPGFYEAES